MKIAVIKSSLIAMSIGLLYVSAAPAQDATSTAAPAAQIPDNTYITISGLVSKVDDGDEFELTYAGGTIEVDTNDSWPGLFKKDSTDLIKTGDHVTVSGRIDDNYFTGKELDAYALTSYSKGFTRNFRNDAIFPKDYNYAPHGEDSFLADKNTVRLVGRVSEITGNDKFMLAYGNGGTIKVNTNKLQVPGANYVAVGDQVIVYGDVNRDWTLKKEIDARQIVSPRIYTGAR